eukprot:TRINITY_DN2326_c2_g1_i13.p1 TRINITY_DN2326_c2_g1~~TRINITY_DN2326_c2_g1_i13.p1  ORF type:complete len:201 (-),score=-4.52 TRINITY_DN2326_c2_g1_i13:66-668(-)
MQLMIRNSLVRSLYCIVNNNCKIKHLKQHGFQPNRTNRHRLIISLIKGVMGMRLQQHNPCQMNLATILLNRHYNTITVTTKMQILRQHYKYNKRSSYGNNNLNSSSEMLELGGNSTNKQFNNRSSNSSKGGSNKDNKGVVGRLCGDYQAEGNVNSKGVRISRSVEGDVGQCESGFQNGFCIVQIGCFAYDVVLNVCKGIS